MKQLAVEWLNEQMNNIKGSSISMNGSVQFIEKELNNLLEQAKAMEKEQHQETFKQARLAKIFEKNMPPVWESWEQYYNETFKSE